MWLLMDLLSKRISFRCANINQVGGFYMILGQRVENRTKSGVPPPVCAISHSSSNFTTSDLFAIRLYPRIRSSKELQCFVSRADIVTYST